MHDPPSTADLHCAAPLPCILGDCMIQLSHATTYEPPLYLFPELLEKVPRATPPLRVWDAVADAVDVSNSSWRIADVRALSRSPPSPSSCHAVTGAASAVTGAASAAARTLASLIASNRLVQAGLTPSVLRPGCFSAARVLEELRALQARVGLEEEEGAVLLTNHFINLLAWRKLCEINHGPAGEKKEGDTRKRARSVGEEKAVDILDRLRGCGDPWSSEVDDPAKAGLFISGREENLEERVELLETLTRLYKRPWRRLRSQGCQTEYVVPPGTMNITSPYANGQPFRGKGREADVNTTMAINNSDMLSVVDDLGWCPQGRRIDDNNNIDNNNNRGGYAVLIRSTTLEEVGERRIDLSNDRLLSGSSSILFGRSSGVQYGILGNPIYVDLGLGAFTSNPQTISTLHFALLLRPESGEGEEKKKQTGRESSSSASSNKDFTSTHHRSEEEKEKPPQDKGEGGARRESSLGCTVWIMNYGRNGISIVHNGEESSSDKKSSYFSPRYVHGGEVLRLRTGDEIVVGDGEARVSLISIQEGRNSLDGELSRVKNEEEEEREEEISLPAVKRESTIEEECEV